MNDSLRKAYKEIHEKYMRTLAKQPKLRKDLDEVTLNNPVLLMSEGFKQLNEQNKEADEK